MSECGIKGMLPYKDRTLIGSSNEVAAHADLSVVLPDRGTPVGWAKSPALVFPVFFLSSLWFFSPSFSTHHVGWAKRSVPNIHLATVFFE